MNEHGVNEFFGTGTGTLVVLLATVALGALAALCATRWDALLLWLKKGFFWESPEEQASPLQAPGRVREAQIPRQLHAACLQHQAPLRRPEFHRSGRRA